MFNQFLSYNERHHPLVVLAEMDGYEWNDDEWIEQWIRAGSGQEEDKTLSSSSSLSKKRQEDDDEWFTQWISAGSGEEENGTSSSSLLSKKRQEHDDECFKQWISAGSGKEENGTSSSSLLSKKGQEHDDEWFKQWISAGSGEEEDETLSSSWLSKKRQEQMLRHAGVVRIMRRVLPSSAKIAVDAKETVQECATEFVAYVTNEAAQRCKMEKRKIITGDDIVRTMASLGFENYIETLKTCLRRYREIQVDAADVDPKQGPARGKGIAEPSTSYQTNEENGDAGNEMDWRRADEN